MSDSNRAPTPSGGKPLSTISTRRVPAEWEPQACVWLAWPHNRATWPGRFDGLPSLYARWIQALCESTCVKLLADQIVADTIPGQLSALKNLEIVEIATNDCWVRDYGPTFVHNQSVNQIEAVSWRYNAWGGKYPPWDLDDSVAPKLSQHQSIACHQSNLCLEGGALEFDGGNRMLTTPDCLVNDTRNPGIGQTEIVQELHRRLGVQEIVWIDGGGLAGDDTDGHIDQLARFVGQENVVVAVCDEEGDENRHPLEENFRQLRLWGAATHPRVEVHRLPIPPARFIEGRRVPESYCNFLRLGRERMLVPTFGAPSDDVALALLRETSGADVVAIDCRDLVWGLGALHCASLNQPRLG